MSKWVEGDPQLCCALLLADKYRVVGPPLENIGQEQVCEGHREGWRRSVWRTVSTLPLLSSCPFPILSHRRVPAPDDPSLSEVATDPALPA